MSTVAKIYHRTLEIFAAAEKEKVHKPASRNAQALAEKRIKDIGALSVGI